MPTAQSAKSWTFSQLGGPQTTLTLNGWQAPFGRPRQGTIVNAGVSIRRTVTYYPDADGGPVAPTIHVFGTEPKSVELHGRWMDRAIGVANGARQMRESWRDFILGKQQVRAKWGDILSFIVFIHDLDLNFEAESHIAWKMTMDVILDEQAPARARDVPVKTPIDFANELGALLAQWIKPDAPKPFFTLRGFLGQVSDTIDSIVQLINSPFQVVFDIASTISDFESALSSDLVTMTSGLQLLKTSVLNLRDMTELAMADMLLLNERTVDLPVGVFSAPDVVAARATKIEQDRDFANVLALIADMQAEIARAQRGRALTAHQAQDGDTWESISTLKYGSPSGANTIRGANAVRYGQRAQAGKVYIVPKQQ